MSTSLAPAGYSYPFAWTSRETMGHQLLATLGTAAKVASITEQLDEIVVEYDLGGDSQFGSHEDLLNRMAMAAGQLAYQVLQAEIVEYVSWGVETATVSGLAALGVTAKQKPEIALLATAASLVGGFLVGHFLPPPKVVLRGALHPYYGWVWTQVEQPTPGWGTVTGQA